MDRVSGVQSGFCRWIYTIYLTVKDYDKRRKVYRLDFPNDEVRKGFVSLIGNIYFHMPEEDNDNWMYLNDKRKVHNIGVNISSETRTVDGWKETD